MVMWLTGRCLPWSFNPYMDEVGLLIALTSGRDVFVELHSQLELFWGGFSVELAVTKLICYTLIRCVTSPSVKQTISIGVLLLRLGES